MIIWSLSYLGTNLDPDLDSSAHIGQQKERKSQSALHALLLLRKDHG